MSRLDNKESGIVIVLMQRLHQDDLCGYLLRETTGWTHLELPAIAIMPQEIPIGRGRFHYRAVGDILRPKFESEAVLMALRDSMGPAQWSAQYQQRPIPVEGEFLNPEWFRYYETVPERDSQSYVMQSWDTASKDGVASSHSACTTWLVLDKEYYLLDVYTGRLNFPALREMALVLSQKHKPSYILIEDASTGSALAAELKLHHGQSAIIRLVKPDQDKRVRLYIQQSKFASGQVWFPRRAPWLRAFLDELLSFPDGKYSDQVDSLSQALASKRPYLDAFNRAYSLTSDSYLMRYAMAQSRRF